MQVLEHLFITTTGLKPQQITELSPAGSNRRYFRITASQQVHPELSETNTDTERLADNSIQHWETNPSSLISLIGVMGTSLEENRAFVAMANHFGKLGLPVPKVLATSSDDRFYLQEDLGDSSLFDAIAGGRETGIFSEKEKQYLSNTLRWLPRFQVNGAQNFDFSVCYPQPAFNRRSVFWDLNYFKYNFLKTTGVDFQESRLEDDFERLADVLLDETATDSLPFPIFMYRDFQSRNVLLRNGNPYFIDFQGGRKGPLFYDLTSFLWQARANFSKELRDELIEVYLTAMNELLAVEHRGVKPLDKVLFISQLRHFVLFRLLQVLGAYGFRGYFEKKVHFLLSIPFALNSLKEVLQDGFVEYPYLVDVLLKMCEQLENDRVGADLSVDITQPKGGVKTPVSMAGIAASTASAPPAALEVTVVSFAYPKGLPRDASGNGGGFIFDCRAVHNPGRYEPFKKLTGLDEPVQQFLEKDGEVLNVLNHAQALVDVSVKRYLERGFTSLMVCFGCTGGQHRSVYSAQKMAEHLHATFGVKVHLLHREQQIEKYYETNM
jgi:aminoglycoside/choline kinase family phosphotransferase